MPGIIRGNRRNRNHRESGAGWYNPRWIADCGLQILDCKTARQNLQSEIFHLKSAMPAIFPFTAIVGQERMKRALVLNAVNPRIGGVLIRGERGTAKSTAARALAALLPEVRVVKDCRFGCDPDRPTT